MSTEPQIRYTRTSDGANIAYGTLGAGPVIVLLPSVQSFTGRTRVFPTHSALLEALTPHFTVVQYDGRGMGLSSRDRREYELEQKLLDLDAVIAAVGADTVSLYGWLFGGLTAMAYADRYPQRVASLVLIDTFSAGERFYRENPNGRVLDALGVVTAEQWVSVTDMIGGRTQVQDAPLDAGREAGAVLRETWNADEFMAHRQAVRRTDMSKQLGSISAPTLVVASGGGGALIEHSRELASAIPNARLIQITAAWAGWPARDYATVVAFLSEHARPADSATAEPRSETSVRAGVTTVLFTDIVGHTEMMQRLGDAQGRDVLREHERITRETLKQHGGAEVKTMGDGFMASFGSVTSAMECAIALQRAFAAHSEGEREPLSVRVGLNAGEPIEEDGDLFGSTVILASRIAAKAGAGEILVPDTVRGLLSGKGFVFGDRGEFVPKGFDEGVRLWDVRWRESK